MSQQFLVMNEDRFDTLRRSEVLICDLMNEHSIKRCLDTLMCENE